MAKSLRTIPPLQSRARRLRANPTSSPARVAYERANRNADCASEWGTMKSTARAVVIHWWRGTSLSRWLPRQASQFLSPTQRHADVAEEVILELPHLAGNLLHDAHSHSYARTRRRANLYPVVEAPFSRR